MRGKAEDRQAETVLTPLPGAVDIELTMPEITELRLVGHANSCWQFSVSDSFGNRGVFPEERYKALVGLGVPFSSPDGIHWEPMRQERILSEYNLPRSPFDSQNVAFFDTVRGHYAAYIRGSREEVGRSSSTATNW